jgi:hypothetical protein
MDIATLRTKVFQKHGVKLDERDPILLVATITQEIHTQALEELQSVVDNAARNTTNAVADQLRLAQGMAAGTVSDAARSLSTEFRKTATQACDDMLRRMRQEAERAEQAAHEAKGAMWTSIAVAGVLLVLLAVVIFRLVR